MHIVFGIVVVGLVLLGVLYRMGDRMGDEGVDGGGDENE
jgi:hypothetical protein